MVHEFSTFLMIIYFFRLAVKKTAAKGKAAKDPNKPKRPASAFFVFMLVIVVISCVTFKFYLFIF